CDAESEGAEYKKCPRFIECKICSQAKSRTSYPREPRNLDTQCFGLLNCWNCDTWYGSRLFTREHINNRSLQTTAGERNRVDASCLNCRTIMKGLRNGTKLDKRLIKRESEADRKRWTTRPRTT
ncbi:unnamed protein product, partial [Amoebophrya sp. A25]